MPAMLDLSKKTMKSPSHRPVRATPTGRPKRMVILSVFYPFGSARRTQTSRAVFGSARASNAGPTHFLSGTYPHQGRPAPEVHSHRGGSRLPALLATLETADHMLFFCPFMVAFWRRVGNDFLDISDEDDCDGTTEDDGDDTNDNGWIESLKM